MTHVAVKVEVIESERGWGAKTDDYMVCLSVEDAKAFIKDYNAQNTSDVVPDIYTYAASTIYPIDLNKKQFYKLMEKKRVWLSTLNQDK
jgi:hypothetical protein